MPYPCDTDGHGCPAYSYTQKAPLRLILYGPALACFGLAGVVGSAPGSIIVVAVGPARRSAGTEGDQQ